MYKVNTIIADINADINDLAEMKLENLPEKYSQIILIDHPEIGCFLKYIDLGYQSLTVATVLELSQTAAIMVLLM